MISLSLEDLRRPGVNIYPVGLPDAGADFQ